jgi:hypothetical protein
MERIMFRYRGELYIISFTSEGSMWSKFFECDDNTFIVRYREDHNELRVYDTAMTVSGYLDENECIYTKNIK